MAIRKTECKTLPSSEIEDGKTYLRISGERYRWDSETKMDCWEPFAGVITIDHKRLCELFCNDGQTLGHRAFIYRQDG